MWQLTVAAEKTDLWRSAIQYNIILLRKLSERNLNKVESYRR